jgi:hypothetical protein
MRLRKIPGKWPLACRLAGGIRAGTLACVDASVPLIYSPRPRVTRVSPLGRLAALAIALGCLAILVIAVVIHPNTAGVGSHHQLRLEPCQFLYRTGVPCPTCGMTTSISWFVRGRFAASFFVQPMGFMLAVLVAMTFWAALYTAVTARPVHRLLRFVPWRYYLVPLFVIGVLAWMWKIGIHITGHDGWS